MRTRLSLVRLALSVGPILAIVLSCSDETNAVAPLQLGEKCSEKCAPGAACIGASGAPTPCVTGAVCADICRLAGDDQTKCTQSSDCLAKRCMNGRCNAEGFQGRSVSNSCLVTGALTTTPTGKLAQLVNCGFTYGVQRLDGTARAPLNEIVLSAKEGHYEPRPGDLVIRYSEAKGEAMTVVPPTSRMITRDAEESRIPIVGNKLSIELVSEDGSRVPGEGRVERMSEQLDLYGGEGHEESFDITLSFGAASAGAVTLGSEGSRFQIAGDLRLRSGTPGSSNPPPTGGTVTTPPGLVLSSLVGQELPDVLSTAVATGVLAGTPYFFASRKTSTAERGWLSRTDGTAAGTVFIKDLGLGNKMIYPQLWLGPTQIFWPSAGSVPGTQWWSTDGTEAGTSERTARQNGEFDGVPEAVQVGNYVIYSGASAVRGIRSLDLTSGAVAALTTIDGVRLMGGQTQGAFKYAVFHKSKVGNDELYATTGAGAPTLLHTLALDDNVSASVVQNGDDTYFWLTRAQVTSLWKTTAAAGTAVEVTPAPIFENGVVFKGRAFGLASTSLAARAALWQTDGTAGGTKAVFQPGPLPSGISARLSVTSDAIFFLANTPATNNLLRLFRSDGTTEGTKEVFAHDVYDELPPKKDLTVVGRFLYIGMHWQSPTALVEGLARVPVAGGQIEFIPMKCGVSHLRAFGKHLLAQCNYGSAHIFKDAD
jgi:hypothetical protein